MPYNRPSPNELLNIIQAEFDAALEGADARVTNAVEGVLAKVMVLVSHLAHGHLDWVAKQIHPGTADDENLAMHGITWGRGAVIKPETPASGLVTFTGNNGSVIDVGATLRRSDNVEYILQNVVTITGGTGQGNVVAVVKGAAGNTVAGTKLSLTSPVAGINTNAVAGTNGLVGGNEAETPDEFRYRIAEIAASKPQGGNDGDYINWAREMPGVTRAWSYSGIAGAGTVTVLLVMDKRTGSIIPSSPEIQIVKDYIESIRPLPGTLYVAAPEPLVIDYTIKLKPNTPSVQNAVKAEIEDFHRREAAPGKSLPFSRMNEAISTAPGEEDHELIEPVATVEPTAFQIPIIGTITFEDLV